MIMWENGDIELEVEEDLDCESMLDLEDTSHVEYPKRQHFDYLVSTQHIGQ